MELLEHAENESLFFCALKVLLMTKSYFRETIPNIKTQAVHEFAITQGNVDCVQCVVVSKFNCQIHIYSPLTGRNLTYQVRGQRICENNKKNELIV